MNPINQPKSTTQLSNIFESINKCQISKKKRVIYIISTKQKEKKKKKKKLISNQRKSTTPVEVKMMANQGSDVC